MLIDEIRLRKLKQLVAQSGSIVAVADAINTAPAYLSQILNGAKSSTGTPRSVGSKLARKIEEAFGKPIGWMDQEGNTVLKDDLIGQAHSLVVHSFQKSSDEFVTINQYQEVGASMGVGVLLAEQPGQITSWNVTKEWLAKNIPANTGSGNLSIITGFGDSMKGMFNPGDPIVIDTGIKACKHDGVFFFRVGDEGFIKRLQRIPGKGIKVISTNPEYESWTITPDMDFQVLGKVLKVWESTEF